VDFLINAYALPSHAVIKGRPCKIVEIKPSNKDGHGEIHLVAIDIFTGKKLEDVCPPGHSVNVPAVTRADYQFLYIEDDTLHLLGPNDAVKAGVKVPDNEIGAKIRYYGETGVDVGQGS
jgi:translation initiation factor 5A